MTEKKQEDFSNSRRFLSAFNNIDYAIRVHHNFNRSMGFSELVRKAVAVNYVVRKYEDDLINYGRLRNAIVHNSNEDIVIAEPHDSVVEDIERIEKLLTTPPRALDIVGGRKIITVKASENMRSVICTMASSTFSNLPVYGEKGLIGVANGQKILDSLGKYIMTGGKADVFLDQVQIEDMLSSLVNSNYYMVVPTSFTVEQALGAFHTNAKLLAILITKTGKLSEDTLGIITGANVIEMNKALENF